MQNAPREGPFCEIIELDSTPRSLPPMRAKLILTLTERGQGEATREDAAEISGSTRPAVLIHFTAKG